MSQAFRSLGWFVAVWFASFLNVIASNSLACTQDEPPGLTVQELSAIPNSVGVAGPFVGVIDNQLIVAGGANFPDAPPWEGGTKVWHDSAYVLNELNGQWQNAGQLPRALGYGVSVSLPQGMLCIGGSDLGRHYPDVFLCRLQEKQLVSQNCQALPIPLANACGGRVGDWVLVAAGSEEPGERSASARVFGLFVGSSDAQPLPQRSWVEFPALPSSDRILPGAAAFKDQLYVFGGAAIEFTEGRWQRRYLQDAWCLTVDRQQPIRSQWKQVRDLPNFVVASPSPSPILGPNHFLVLGGDDGRRVGFQPVSEQPGFNPQAWLYHRVTDTWTPAGNLPIARVTTGVVAWKDGWAVPTGEIRPGVRTPLVHHLKWQARTPSFGWLNYTVLIAYLVVILAVGTGMAGLARTTDQFYRAGQSIPWWAASLSIFATMLSSITFMSIPAQGYSVGWNLFLGSVYVVSTPLIVYVYLPFFRRLNVTSAYEYFCTLGEK
jgi:solute:Na+ symporter, SSS family